MQRRRSSGVNRYHPAYPDSTARLGNCWRSRNILRTLPCDLGLESGLKPLLAARRDSSESQDHARVSGCAVRNGVCGGISGRWRSYTTLCAWAALHIWEIAADLMSWGRRKGRRFRGPMKNFLSTIDLTLWLILIVSKLILCLCIFKKHFAKRLLYFSLFIFVSSAKSLLLVAIASWASYNAYYDTFYFGGYLESALGFLTLIECGRQVLPGLDLPKKEKAFAWLGAALAAVFILAIAWPTQLLSPFLPPAVSSLFAAAQSCSPDRASGSRNAGSG